MRFWGQHHMLHTTGPHNTVSSAAPCADTYHCGVYDTEGILATLNVIVLSFLGLQAGRILVHYKNVSPWAMVKRWLFWGVSLCVIATGLCSAYKNDGVMPLNRSMWSPSFIACTAGTGVLLFISLAHQSIRIEGCHCVWQASWHLVYHSCW